MPPVHVLRTVLDHLPATHKDKQGMQRVLEMHRDAVSGIDASLVPEELLSAAQAAWDECS